MKLSISKIKREPSEKNYKKELFKYKLKHWFESMDVDELSEYLEIETGDISVIRYAMETYADKLFDYVEENKEMLLKASGKTENEEELFSLKIGVFDHQGICLDYEAGEVLEDKISFSEGKELWLLENGDFVVICCIGYEGTDGSAEYRYLDYKLSNFEEAGVDMDRFMLCLDKLL